jgi:hypothetical protein
MNIIKSTVTKEKKNKKTIYSFSFDNEIFEAHYIMSKKPTVELFHNGSHLGLINDLKVKHDFLINPDSNPMKLTIWIEFNIYSIYIGKINEIGIKIDENTVQNTLADPEAHIKNGRSGFFVLFLILGFKCIFIYYSIFKEYSSHIVSGISMIVYLIPLLLALIAFIKYVQWTKFALITGIIISVLEMLDYLIALPNSIMTGTNGASLLIWILIRISVICIFFTTLKWKIKSKNIM